MAASPTQMPTGSIPLNDDDDTFERDLTQMLKDGPSLNDMSSTVQGGKPQAYIKPDTASSAPSSTVGAPTSLHSATSTGIPRSHSVPPGRSFLGCTYPVVGRFKCLDFIIYCFLDVFFFFHLQKQCSNFTAWKFAYP